MGAGVVKKINIFVLYNMYEPYFAMKSNDREAAILVSDPVLALQLCFNDF